MNNHKHDLFTIYGKLNNMYNNVREVYKVHMNETEESLKVIINYDSILDDSFFPKEIDGYKVEVIKVDDFLKQKGGIAVVRIEVNEDLSINLKPLNDKD